MRCRPHQLPGGQVVGGAYSARRLETPEIQEDLGGRTPWFQHEPGPSSQLGVGSFKLPPQVDPLELIESRRGQGELGAVAAPGLVLAHGPCFRLLVKRRSGSGAALHYGRGRRRCQPLWTSDKNCCALAIPLP